MSEKKTVTDVVQELAERLKKETTTEIGAVLAWEDDGGDIPTMAIACHAPNKDAMVAFLKAAIYSLEANGEAPEGKMLVEVVRGSMRKATHVAPGKGN